MKRKIQAFWRNRPFYERSLEYLTLSAICAVISVMLMLFKLMPSGAVYFLTWAVLSGLMALVHYSVESTSAKSSEELDRIYGLTEQGLRDEIEQISRNCFWCTNGNERRCMYSREMKIRENALARLSHG